MSSSQQQQTKQTKTFHDLWLTVSTTDTHIDYIARPGAVWSDMEAWLETEWSGKHWRWRDFGGRVIVWREACGCDECDEEEEEKKPRPIKCDQYYEACVAAWDYNDAWDWRDDEEFMERLYGEDKADWREMLEEQLDPTPVSRLDDWEVAYVVRRLRAKFPKTA